MATRNYYSCSMVTFLGLGLLWTVLSKNTFAHCDTLDGPVVQTARMAFDAQPLEEKYRNR
jgi:hypothetical protein